MFIKHDKNPVVKREKNTFYSKHTANPDILAINQKIIMYFREQVLQKTIKKSPQLLEIATMGFIQKRAFHRLG
jgi:predicted GH43/DUF377 family glycosyl hydrolase